MTLHDLELAVTQSTRLEKHTIGNRDLSDVVKRARYVDEVAETGIHEISERPLRKKILGEAARVRSNALEVCAGLRVSRFGQACHGENRKVSGLERSDPLPHLDSHQKLGGLKGLRDEIVSAGGQSFHRGFRRRVRGQKNHVDVAVPIRLPHSTAEFQAVHFGHIPVRNDDGTRLSLENCESFSTVRRGQDFVA